MDLKLIYFQLLLEYIKVFLWPGIFILFFLLFNKQISKIIGILINLLAKANKVNVAGVMEIANQPEILSTSLNADNVNKTVVIDVIAKYERQLAEHNADHEKYVNNLLFQLAYKDLQIDFEKIYRLVFGSQIQLLKDMNTQTSDGSSRYLAIFFLYMQQVHKPVFDSWGFDQYLSFLVRTNLITLINSSYQITEKGKAFLAYLVQSGYSEDKPL